MVKKINKRRAWWPVILAIWPLLAQAQGADSTDAGLPPLRLNGFGTLGIAHGETNFDGSFRRDISQRPGQTGTRANWDSRLGVQANYSVTENIELVGQVVARTRPYSNTAKDAVEWAFASFRVTPETTIRVGRTGMDLFLISDYRNVGFAYTAARPNLDFYSVLPLDGLNGADVSYQWRAGEASWRAKLFGGRGTYDVSGSYRGQLDNVLGLTLSRESEGLLARATIARTTMGFQSADLAALHGGLTQVAQTVPVPSVANEARQMLVQGKYRDIGERYLSAGFSYDRDNWLLSGEYMRSTGDAPAASARAAYLTGGRRIGSFTWHTSVSSVRNEIQATAIPQWDQALAPLAPLLGAATIQQVQALGVGGAMWINSGGLKQRTVSVGVRWDFDPRMALKLQWDRVHVSPTGGLLWSGKESGGRANVGTAVLDFMF